MDYLSLITGVILAGIGLLAYHFPALVISGLNTMSDERRAMVDIEGLRRSFRNILMITGGILVLYSILGYLFDFDPAWASWVMPSVVIIMAILLVIYDRKYDKGFGKGSTKSISTLTLILIFVLMFLTIAFVGTVLIRSAKPAKVEVTPTQINIGGMYGRQIAWDDVASVRVVDELPEIRMRTNGSALGSRLKGHFLLQNGENCLMFLDADVPPFIEIRTNEDLIYLNLNKAEETKALAAEMKAH